MHMEINSTKPPDVLLTPRDLKFCVDVAHLRLFVHVKFHVNAAFVEAATFLKVQKLHLYCIFAAFLQHNNRPYPYSKLSI